MLAVAAGRIGSAFFTLMRNRSLPGRPIADCQTRLYMSFRQAETTTLAAAKAGSAPRLRIASNGVRDCRRKRKSGAAADGAIRWLRLGP